MSKRKIGELLKGPKRLEGESFEDYKIRRRAEQMLTKNYLRGTPVEAKNSNRSN
jgi:hypothetical protein|tara:strand:- start:5138 stop:5299 length:162 start_codon:yes stop_codon:yes gene_type:complete